MNSFKVLLETLNATLEVLNKNGYHIRDVLNPSFYIVEVTYDRETDKLYSEYKEDRQCDM